MRRFARCVAVLVWGSLCVAPALAFDAFKISDIRVEGLQRISLGTVLNYLPVNVGDTFTDSRSADTIRALFKTGFFDEVRIGRSADVLVISVDERPAIAAISISGNKDIETDKLKEALKSVGLVEGRVFDRSTLDKVEREIENQYFSQGKYGVKVASKVTPQEIASTSASKSRRAASRPSGRSISSAMPRSATRCYAENSSSVRRPCFRFSLAVTSIRAASSPLTSKPCAHTISTTDISISALTPRRCLLHLISATSI